MDRIRARAASPATPQGYSASTPNGSISNQPHVPDAVTTAESDLNAVQNNDSDRKILAEIMRDSISEDSEIRANLCKHYDRAFLGGIADTMVDGKSIYENIVKDIANEISRGTGNEAYNTYIGDGVLSATVSILKAAYNDDLASLRTALDWGKQTAPNAFDEIVFIARFVAARFGRMNIAKILFTIRDHCVQRDNEENTCLHLAALFNHPEMVKFLITRQSDIESRNKDGHTPWTQIGSSEEHERVSQLLIEAGTDVNCKVDGTHLLHDFAGRGEANKVLLLLQRGVNPCLRVQGSTALQFAVQNGDLETIRILEEATKNCNNVSHEKKDQAAKSRSRPDITDYFPPGTSTIPILRDHHHPRRSE
ncbi:ankyrin repeat domain-containing protein [Aspergillus fijiensis CBS 313.89]|uniref:Ankyrin n=1 Tax=Aspergillus fijiensis CBS 313.89 TaxID=1448319 RepID=A0A8G1W1R2_9EURO|nr:ankyrin [Aspergillus fijiensis CBS 313.89]RAK81225.1 ankyrin [Aspergillus fijiensis CBS 313.89]